jgi:hypothetical protein
MGDSRSPTACGMSGSSPSGADSVRTAMSPPLDKLVERSEGDARGLPDVHTQIRASTDAAHQP